MFTIGARVKEERERLEMTIPEFAEAAGVKKNTVIDWQKDVSSPPAARLAALASAGLDVQYVVIGVRSSILAGREALLLEGFRKMDEATQERTLAMVYSGTPPAPTTTQKFHGPVGQVTEGNAVFNKPVTFFDQRKKGDSD